MTKVGLILGFVLFALPSMAQFSGTWRGAGSKSGPKGSVNCSYIGFRIAQSRTSISISGGSIVCGGQSKAIPSLSGSIRANGTITYWGMSIGYITASSIHVDTTLGGGRKVLDMNRSGNSASFYFASAGEATSGNLSRIGGIPMSLLADSDAQAELQEYLGPEYLQIWDEDSSEL